MTTSPTSNTDPDRAKGWDWLDENGQPRRAMQTINDPFNTTAEQIATRAGCSLETVNHRRHEMVYVILLDDAVEYRDDSGERWLERYRRDQRR